MVGEKLKLGVICLSAWLLLPSMSHADTFSAQEYCRIYFPHDPGPKDFKSVCRSRYIELIIPELGAPKFQNSSNIEKNPYLSEYVQSFERLENRPELLSHIEKSLSGCKASNDCVDFEFFDAWAERFQGADHSAALVSKRQVSSRERTILDWAVRIPRKFVLVLWPQKESYLAAFIFSDFFKGSPEPYPIDFFILEKGVANN